MEKRKPIISTVTPCYNEEAAIPLFYQELCRVAEEMADAEFEFLFVDDGSKDGTLEILRELNQRDARVHYVSFSRNFGKEAGIYAGLEAAQGDYAVVMDVDLQDPPALLPQMYRILQEEDYDCVATRRVSRQGEPPVRSFFARRFYRFINKISSTEIVDGARDFRMMKKIVAGAIIKDQEYNRFSKGIFSWVGFRTKWLEYENIERSAGKTKWSFWKLLIYAVNGIVAYSTAPLVAVSIGGGILCLLAFITFIAIILRTLLFGDPVAGWPSLVCAVIFLGGVQLLGTGILGLYLSKTYLETKGRQIYIIREKA